ncbi:DNA recombination protein RmuC [Litorimonas haliclonae]|uniref:DNA recombination protein RmuC n=1 Tax=Litorimonas haliclonae TaxID=2081977 RepID=UPI0039F11392
MEPLLSFGGLDLSLVHIILLLAFALIGAMITMIFSSGRKDPEGVRQAAQLREKLLEMQAQQGELQGRLSQFAEDSAQRDTMFRQSLDERLSKVSERVGKSIVDTQERNSANLKQLHERLALIDRAQKNIETLSGEVSGLQSLLSNKQARGAFGEKQMQDLIETYLPPNAFSFQHTLSNGKRVDALIHLPGEQGDVAIDSKFPMEAWRRLTEADNTDQTTVAKRGFAADVTRHINDIAGKYLIFGETHDIAMLFLPSEAVYAELHTHFPQVIEHGFTKKVMIVSPTTFMATLHTMRAVMRDAAMREQAHIIQSEVGKMSKDVTRLDERVAKLQSHFNQTTEDMRQIRISTEKISGRADKIESLELKERDSSTGNIAQFPKTSE